MSSQHKLDLFRVVGTSPSDVSEEHERAAQAIEELNAGVASDRSLHIRYNHWKRDSYPGVHEHGPQGLIDPILKIKECDVLLCIFWARFGTPVHDARSGTEHEFNAALQAWQEADRPFIMVYFRNGPYGIGTSEEALQLYEVLRFKEQLPKEILHWSYDDPDDFERQFRQHLRNHIRGQYPIRQNATTFSDVVEPSALDSISPESPDDLQATVQHLTEKALGAIKRKAFPEAYEVWSRLISMLPDNPIPYYNRGLTNFYLERFTDALADYDAAIDRFPKIPELAFALNNRGLIHGNLGSSSTAIADFTRALSITPDLAQAYHNRGITHQRDSDYEAALADYDQAIEHKPDYADAHLNRGMIHGWEGRQEKAWADFNRAVELVPDDARPLWHRGTAYIYLEQYEEAIADFNEALRLKDDYAEAFCNRGVSYEKLGATEQALADYTKAIAIKPDYADAYRNRSIVHAAVGQTAEAREDVDKAIDLNPSDSGARNTRGISYAREERNEEALADFSAAIALDPNFADAYNNRGNVLRNRSPEKSLADFDKAIRLGPVRAEYYHNRSTTYWLQEKNDEALSDANEAVRRNPDSPKIRTHRGNVHYALKHYDHALADFDEAIRLDDRLAGAYSGRGNTLLKLSQYQEAREDLERAAKLDPSGAATYLALAEALVFTRSYDLALNTAQYTESIVRDNGHRTLSYYFSCIALRLSGNDTGEADGRLEELMSVSTVPVKWSFDEMRIWLERANLDAADAAYILRLTKQLEQGGEEREGG